MLPVIRAGYVFLIFEQTDINLNDLFLRETECDNKFACEDISYVF